MRIRLDKDEKNMRVQGAELDLFWMFRGFGYLWK